MQDAEVFLHPWQEITGDVPHTTHHVLPVQLLYMEGRCAVQPPCRIKYQQVGPGTEPLPP